MLLWSKSTLLSLWTFITASPNSPTPVPSFSQIISRRHTVVTRVSCICPVSVWLRIWKLLHLLATVPKPVLTLSQCCRCQYCLCLSWFSQGCINMAPILTHGFAQAVHPLHCSHPPGPGSVLPPLEMGHSAVRYTLLSLFPQNIEFLWLTCNHLYKLNAFQRK